MEKNPQKELFDKIVKICVRAEDLGISVGARIDRIMDVENAVDAFNIDVDRWLAADNFNFSHDYAGIVNNIKRNLGIDHKYSRADFKNNFVPRFSQIEETQKIEDSTIIYIKQLGEVEADQDKTTFGDLKADFIQMAEFDMNSTPRYLDLIKSLSNEDLLEEISDSLDWELTVGEKPAERAEKNEIVKEAKEISAVSNKEINVKSENSR